MLNTIRNSKNPLVIAVGGGNDSVSALLLLAQLKNTFAFNPEKITVLAMLPDVLEYHQVERSNVPGLVEINEDSYRSVQGKNMGKFPEQVLATHKDEFKIDYVYGCLMNSGSDGVLNTLSEMAEYSDFDAIFAFDVGGDFIAVNENHQVLSPMMDGYVLYALKHLKTDIPIVYGVFGLGTDGESTEYMLDSALMNPRDLIKGKFNSDAIEDEIKFYRDKVEPVRYSRTADFTIRQIVGHLEQNPVPYRARFHVGKPDGSSSLYYGYFDHFVSEKHAGNYYLFKDSSSVQNRFSISCRNGIEWFIQVQNEGVKFNTEMNGQAYMNLWPVMKDSRYTNISLFFGTPSLKFDAQAQRDIFTDTVAAVLAGVYNFAFVWNDQLEPLGAAGLYTYRVNDYLSVLYLNPDYEELIIDMCTY